MRKLIALVLVATMVTSCAHVTYQNSTHKPISFTRSLGTEKKFQVTGRANNDYRRQWLFWYLLPIGKDGTDMIADSVGGADALANLKIIAVYDVLDMLVTTLTLGIYSTRLVNIQGDLMRASGNP